MTQLPRFVMAAVASLYFTGCGTVPIQPPSTVDVAAESDGSVLVTWNASAAGQLRVERSVNGAPFVALTTLAGDAMQFTDPNAPAGSRYRVLAFDEDPRGGSYSKAATTAQN